MGAASARPAGLEAAGGVIRLDDGSSCRSPGRHALKTLEAIAPFAGLTATIAPPLEAFHAAFIGEKK